MSDRKAFRVVAKRFPDHKSFVAAASAAQAKHFVIRLAREAGFDLSYTDRFSVQRRPSADAWATSDEGRRHPVVEENFVTDWLAKNSRE